MRRIQFGCGENRIPGWENFDSDLDVTKLPLSFADGVADMILAEHLGEHLTGPELLHFLDECYRILKPKGVMHLYCPVIPNSGKLKLEHARDLALNHGHKLVLNKESMEVFLWMAGFKTVFTVDRPDFAGHWKVIGKDKDDLETCRLCGVK